MALLPCRLVGVEKSHVWVLHKVKTLKSTWLHLCMPRARPRVNLRTWLKQELGTHQHGKFTKVLNAYKFDKDNKLTPPRDGCSSSWTWEGLGMFNNLERANKALMPSVGSSDLSKEAFKGNPVPFFKALLDKLVKLMDNNLCQAHPTSSGVAFFGTKFRWSIGRNTEKDCNVCMPWTLTRVKKAPYMYVSRGYLRVKLGDGSEPSKPCMEYAHRLVCFLFNGAPPEGKKEVSHWCHNKECLNPGHLLWATHEENHNQPRRLHDEDKPPAQVGG